MSRPTPTQSSGTQGTGAPPRRAVTSLPWQPVARTIGIAVVFLLVVQAVFGHSTGSLGPIPTPAGVPSGVIAQGVVIGTLYGLVALGLVLVYRSDRIINFAQAGLGSLPALVGIVLVLKGSVPWVVGLLITLVGSVAMGVLVRTVILRRLLERPRLVLTVGTIGVSQLVTLGEVYVPQWIGQSGQVSSLPTPFTGLKHSFGGVVFTGDSLAVIIAAVLLCGGLSYFLTRTRLGLAVRASAENADRARLLGIPVARVGVIVWVIAAVCSGLAVFLRAPLVGVPIGSSVSPTFLLYALAAAVLARMESLPIALGAGMAVGVIDQAAFYVSRKPDLSIALVLPVLIIGLLRSRGPLSRASESGLGIGQSSAEARGVPRELRDLREVKVAKWAGLGVVLLLAVLVPYILRVDQLGDASIVIAYALVGLSLVVLTGWTGQVSLGQFAFAGVGAGITGMLAANHGADMIVTMICAALAGAVVAVIIGLPALRIQGMFLAAVTLALAATVTYLLEPDIVPGLLPKDPVGVRRPILFKRWDLGSDRAFYWFSLVILVLIVLAVRALARNRTRRVFIATRDNRRAAQSYGVSPARSKLVAFAIAGAIAALGGSLLAYQSGTISDQAFPIATSLNVFAFTVVGGLASPAGALLGALYFEGLKLLGPVIGVRDFDTLGVALAALVVLAFLPGGVASALENGRDELLRRLAVRKGIEVPSLAGRTGARDALQEGTGEDAPAARPVVDEAPDDAALVVRGAEVSYGPVQVLFGVDIHVGRGEAVALLGTNGAGKSTLLRAVSGLMTASSGTIMFEGQDITRMSARDRVRLGIIQVPGGRAVFPTMTVAEHLAMASWMVRGGVRAERARETVLEHFPRLRERLHQHAGNLSGGEQQQLALGMAFVAAPRLLIIDELSLGLAPATVELLLGLVKEINRRGATVILVEQSLNVALTAADRAYFMEKGEVRFSGPTAELLERDDIVRSVFLEGAAENGLPTSAERSAVVDSRPVTAGADGGKPDLSREPVVLRVENLSVRFGGVTAVDGVSLELHRGEILGVIGPNGAGKTTVFDLISGFMPPSGGRVWLGEEEVTNWSPHRRAWAGLGRSFQDARLFPALTVEQNLATAYERHIEVRDHLATAWGLPDVKDAEADIARQVDELIELMNLQPFRDMPAGALSTGTRRLVDLAMSLAHSPSVLVLDEPSSGVAQRETEALAPLLDRIRRETGCAMLLVEHDMPFVAGLSDRLLALDLGKVVTSGPPREVLTDPRVMAAYLGTDEAAINRSGSSGVLSDIVTHHLPHEDDEAGGEPPTGDTFASSGADGTR